MVLLGLLFTFLGFAIIVENTTIKIENTGILEKMGVYACRRVMQTYFPVFLFMEQDTQEFGIKGEIEKTEKIFFPLYAFLEEAKRNEIIMEDNYTLSMFMDEEAIYSNQEQTAQTSEMPSENIIKDDEDEVIFEPDYLDKMQEENHHATIFAENEFAMTAGSGFVSIVSGVRNINFEPAIMKKMQYSYANLADYQYVMENFYIVDATTSAGADKINPAALLETDVTIDKTSPGPQILIYHTHSQEAFADSVPGNIGTTIVGAGARLSQILEEEYGYDVYHHMGQYDVESRDYAYNYAGPAVEGILEKYPQIEVIIDLHRDAVNEDRRLVLDVNGTPTAQFMFFNGLCYTNQKGNIDYLPNPVLNDNLAFSLKMQIASNEYYPGLARKIYLKGYRYNMHFRGKSLLVEMGAQTNTVNEIMNACEPLADVIDKVLSGEDLP